MRGRGAKISGDGRFVAFSSPAAVLDGTPGVALFIRDRIGNVTARLTVANAQAASDVLIGGLSADGRVIAFGANQRVLPLDGEAACEKPDGCIRPYIHTRHDGETLRLDAIVTDQSAHSFEAAPIGVSADGRMVLVASTSNGTISHEPTSLYVYDRADARLRLLHAVVPGSVLTSVPAALSADGATVAACHTFSAESRALITLDLRTAIIDTPYTIPAAEPHDCATSIDLAVDGRMLFAASGASSLVPADQNDASDIFFVNLDSDEDGMPSGWETSFGLDPSNAGDAAADPDGDGLTNLQEYQRGSHPRGLFTRYFAEGVTNAFFVTEIGLFNPADSPNRIVVTHLGANQIANSWSTQMAPDSRASLSPRYEAVASLRGEDAPDPTFATIIESERPIVAERSVRWSDLPGGGSGSADDVSGSYGAHGETGADAPRTEWHFAEGATGVYNLYYLLLNPNETAAHVSVRYLRPAPATPIDIDYKIPPRSRLSIDVNAEPGLSATEVAATITADRPILAERSQYLSTPGQAWGAGHGGAGVAEPATQWFVAEGATGFFRLYLVIANPGAGDAALTVAYLLPDGTRIEKPYTAAKASRLTIDVAGEDARFADGTLSMVVTSDNGVPVVVERVMWWPAEGPYEASVTAASTATGTDWGGALVPVGVDLRDASSYLLVANPSNQDSEVTVRLSGNPNLPVCVATRELLANSRLTIDLREICSFELTGQTLAVTVRSNGPAIVVERATYTHLVRGAWPNREIAQFWAAGEAVALTRIDPLPPE